VTIVGTISPPAGDFSEPVTSKTLSIVQSFWALDKTLAQRKQFPSVNWNISFSYYDNIINEYFNKNYDSNFSEIKLKARQLLRLQNDILEKIQIISKDSLSEIDKSIFDISNIFIEEFLAQNVFTYYDCTCPVTKTVSLVS